MGWWKDGWIGGWIDKGANKSMDGLSVSVAVGYLIRFPNHLQ